MSKPTEMQNPALAKAKTTAEAQRFLDIAEIRDDVVVLRDGTLRAVLLVSSVNFALKSEDEQNATIAAYVRFLNSLTHPIQIVIQSRRMNIDPYLDKLQKLEAEQTNELLRQQTAEYRQFIKELLDLGEIMGKRFYAVVPYNPISDKRKSFWERLMAVFSPAGNVRLAQKKFADYRERLLKRVGYIASGLSAMSLKTVQLDTQGLIELYYDSYNLELAQQQKLAEVGKLRVEEV